MKHEQVFATLLTVTAVCAGCATTQQCYTESTNPGFAEVCVRFVAPPEPTQLANDGGYGAEARLVVDESYSGFADETCRAGMSAHDSSPYHVALWGGPFCGQDVTYNTVPLTPGPYVFGLFDQERATAYQGWINVNYGDDDILNVLTEWRDTVSEQKQWLGFENKIQGKLSSRDARDFKRFTKELRSIKHLERRLDKAVKAEKCARMADRTRRSDVISDMQVLLMPGTVDFFRPFTRPAFREAELASVRSGGALTKVVLVADYAKSLNKWRRVTDLREDLLRYRSVLREEVQRLEKRKRYYAITDHLYHHDKQFVENERCLQEARGMIRDLDHKTADLRKRGRALMFIAGLFVPDDAFGAFDEEERALRRDRIVLEEEKNRIDQRFADTPEQGCRRVSLERNRQNVIAAIRAIDDDIGQTEEARVALTSLRESTDIIHRHGTARILTATLFDDGVPSHLADAIERESLMTVRLQTTDSLYTPPETDVAEREKTTVRTVGYRP